MKRTIAFGALLVAGLTLAGCASTAHEVKPKDVLTAVSGYNSGYITTPNGRVFCIESPRYALSCDWDRISTE